MQLWETCMPWPWQFTFQNRGIILVMGWKDKGDLTAAEIVL